MQAVASAASRCGAGGGACSSARKPHPSRQLSAAPPAPRARLHIAAPVARSQQEERVHQKAQASHQKAVDAITQLEVLKRERAASQQLRAELDARTRAMANMQQQLEQMEALRQTEAEAAAARFHEFEQALALAEYNIDGDDVSGLHLVALEQRLAAKDAELATAQQLLSELQRRQQQQAEELKWRGASADEVASLRRQLQEQQGMMREAASAAESAEAERCALEDNVSVLLEQSSLLRRQVEKRDAELALLQRELESARQESASATSRLAQLREAVAVEAAATTEVLDRAEAAARMLGEKLLALMQSRQEEEEAAEAAAAAAAEAQERQEQSDAEGSSFLTEEDADALLDELEFLQQQLGKQQRLMENASSRASSAEREAAQLRERLLASAALATAAPAPAVAAIYQSDLERQFSAATAIAAAAEAEAEALAVQNEALVAEVQRLRNESAAATQAAKQAAEAAAYQGPGTNFGSMGATASQLAAALDKMAALERQNMELRDAASKKDAVLAESRKFIQGYLVRSAAASDSRHAAMRDADQEEPPAAPINGSAS